MWGRRIGVALIPAARWMEVACSSVSAGSVGPRV